MNQNPPHDRVDATSATLYRQQQLAPVIDELRALPEAQTTALKALAQKDPAAFVEFLENAVDARLARTTLAALRRHFDDITPFATQDAAIAEPMLRPLQSACKEAITSFNGQTRRLAGASSPLEAVMLAVGEYLDLGAAVKDAVTSRIEAAQSGGRARYQ